MAGIAILAAVALLLAGPSDPAPVGAAGNLTTYDSGHVKVNISAVTDSRAVFDSNYKIEYRGDPVMTEYTVTGAFLDETFVSRFPLSGEPRIEARPVLHPDDGVPQAFLVPLHTDEGVHAEVYIDQEFRSTFGPINLLWGTTNGWEGFREFNASEEVTEGVYRDSIMEFNQGGEPGSRRWAVGNFTRDIIDTPGSGDFVAVLLD